MSPHTNEAPAWFQNRIIDGLQLLYSLCLPGFPAAEVLPLTCVTWVEVLYATRPWDEALDSGRLRTAFTELARLSERWPAPAQLKQHLPPRPVLAPALCGPKPVASEKRKAEVAAARQRILSAKHDRAAEVNMTATCCPPNEIESRAGISGQVSNTKTHADQMEERSCHGSD